MSQRLPQPDPILRLQIEPVSGFDAESGVPRVDVAYGVAAERGRQMDIGRDLAAQRVLALRLAPAAREGEEEALVAAQSVDRPIRPATKRQVIGVVSDLQADQIGDALAQD